MPTVEQQLNNIDAKLDRYTTECQATNAATRELAARVEERLIAHEKQDDKLFAMKDVERKDADKALHARINRIQQEANQERRRPAVYASAGTGIGATLVIVFEVVRGWFGSGGPGHG